MWNILVCEYIGGARGDKFNLYFKIGKNGSSETKCRLRTSGSFITTVMVFTLSNHKEDFM